MKVKNARDKVYEFLERNATMEPWDHVNHVTATTHNGEILAVTETMDNGDTIVTIGEEYEKLFFRGEGNK